MLDILRILSQSYKVLVVEDNVASPQQATMARILSDSRLFVQDSIQSFLVDVATLPPGELALHADRIAAILKGPGEIGKAKAYADVQKIGKARIDPVMDEEDHIDSWIDGAHGAECYARWFFFLHRLAAVHLIDWGPWISQYKLFCTYHGKRYRVTGASRMGDVWLTDDMNRDMGYDLRVPYKECSEWASTELTVAQGPGNKPAPSVTEVSKYFDRLLSSGKNYPVTVVHTGEAYARPAKLDVGTMLLPNGRKQMIVMVSDANGGDHASVRPVGEV